MTQNKLDLKAGARGKATLMVARWRESDVLPTAFEAMEMVVALLSFDQEREAEQRRAANHWCEEANKEHNRAEKLEAELAQARAEIKEWEETAYTPKDPFWLTANEIKKERDDLRAELEKAQARLEAAELVRDVYFRQVGSAWAKVRNRADWQRLDGFKELDHALAVLHKQALAGKDGYDPTK